eukprot:jgi/Botrbrau1/1463/Bobra.178_3s0020.1
MPCYFIQFQRISFVLQTDQAYLSVSRICTNKMQAWHNAFDLCNPNSVSKLNVPSSRIAGELQLY